MCTQLRYTAISAILASFDLFWPIFAYFWVGFTILKGSDGMKKSDFERKNSYLYSQTPPNAPRYIQGGYNHDTVTIHHDKCKFGLFWPIFGWMKPFLRALTGWKKVVLNTKTLICTLKHVQKPTNNPRKVRNTTHDRLVTIHYDKCNFGLFWPILIYFGVNLAIFKGSGGMKESDFERKNTHLCS